MFMISLMIAVLSYGLYKGMLDNFLAKDAEMGMHAEFPHTKVLTVLTICMYSLGENIQLGMRSTIPLKYANADRRGANFGVQNSMSHAGTLLSNTL